MSISRSIYNATIKKLTYFQDVHEYTSSYQVIFDKVVGLLTDNSYYIYKNTEMYFQTTMLINIEIKYSVLVSAIQKSWKNKTINLIEIGLQIIRYFKFMERNKKSNKVVFQTSILIPSSRSRPFPVISKKLCKNQEYIDKGLIIFQTDCYYIKHLELRQKYVLNWIHFCDFQKNLRVQNCQKLIKTESPSHRNS